eukprot:gene8964-35190_t
MAGAQGTAPPGPGGACCTDGAPECTDGGPECTDGGPECSDGAAGRGAGCAAEWTDDACTDAGAAECT